MTKLRALLAGAVIAAFAFGYGFAQQIISYTLTGNEVIVAAVGGPGGSSIFIPTGQLRGTIGYLSSAAVSGTINLTNNQNRLVNTAVISGALTVNTPATPYDGENLEIINAASGANTATVTLTASGSQTVVSGAVATQAQNSSAEWMYILATTTWVRLR